MNAYDFPVKTAEGTIEYLDQYQGKFLLIVNVASKCGLTPQYEGLEKLYRQNKHRGLQVVGFPCNQFGDQEPGGNPEIQQFCSTTYGVSFPIYSKIEVNGDNADPLFRYLRAQAPGDFGPHIGHLYNHVRKTRPAAIGTDEVKWNFTKFLVDPKGYVIRRFEPPVAAEEIGETLPDLQRQYTLSLQPLESKK